MIFVEGGECPLCKGTNFATSWQGRLAIIDVQKSKIAQTVKIDAKGEYAIKVR